MLSWPIAFSSAIGVTASLFSTCLATRHCPPHWRRPCPRQADVPALLRRMGRRAEPDYPPYHRVLHRAVWSPLTARRRLLRLLVAVCVPRGVVLFSLADTIEPDAGAHNAAMPCERSPGVRCGASVERIGAMSVTVRLTTGCLRLADASRLPSDPGML